jgi:diphthine-ammonia ligase
MRHLVFKGFFREIFMKLAVLFSGGKDSTLAALLAKKEGYEISCLVSVISENTESFMFHTPSILQVTRQAQVMGIPLLMWHTSGEKELELVDLENAIARAKDIYGVGGVITGAVESTYQASRVQRICHGLDLECFNPLWQKDPIQLLEDLLENNFKVMLTGVFAYPLDKQFLGKVLDRDFIFEVTRLQKTYSISPSGEGGEFESIVLDCPLFKRGLEVERFEDFGEGHSWRREVFLK